MVTYSVPETHHVRLGGHGGEGFQGVYLILKPGSYRRKAAPTFGPRFASGDPDWNTLTYWQHWAQSCWIGGIGQELWRDDSMFDEAVGLDSSLHDRIQLSRGLIQPDASWLVQSAAHPWTRHFCTYNQELYVLLINPDASHPHTALDSYLYKYASTTDDWTLVQAFVGIYARSIYAWNGRLLIGTSANYIMTYDGTAWVNVDLPASDHATVYSMKGYRDRLYCGFGGVTSHIWRLKTDWKWDGETFFFENPGVGGYVVQMEVHLGFLYMMTEFGSILRTDANNTFNLWDFPAGTGGRGLRSYDGKLFVSVGEDDGTDTASQGVLYQFSGAAVTELKRWGALGKWGGLGMMAVHDRRLYYGASSLFGMSDGFGIAVYDSVEDAHSIFASNVDAVTYPDIENGYGWNVSDIIVFKGRLFMSVAGYGIFRTPMTYRDYLFNRNLAQYDVSGVDLTYPGGWLTSSNFDGGTPGVDKLWREIRVECELPTENTFVYVDYSLDDGRSWVVSAINGQGDGVTLNMRLRVILTNVVGRRFKYRIRLSSSDEDESPVIHAVIVSYLPLIDPNWQWEFTAVISDTMELVDGTVQIVNTLDELATLRQMWRDQAVVLFEDVDGTVWTDGVFILDYDERIIHPEQPTEAEVRFVLLETAEDPELDGGG